MFEESMFTIHSIWESMNSWFTPAILFLLLNVVIGTIAYTSTLANQNKHLQESPPPSPADLQQTQQQKFVIRSPSLIQRFKSINFNSYRSHESKRSSDSDSLFSFEPSSSSQSFEMQSQNQDMKGHYFFEQNPSEITHGKHESADSQEIYQKKSTENRAQKIKVKENVVHRRLPEKNPSEITHGKHESAVSQEIYQKKSTENRAQKIKAKENVVHRRQPENVGSGKEIQRVEEDEQVYISQVNEVHVSRTKSDTIPTAGEVLKKLPAKLKKSASLKSAFKHFEEEDILEARRPATVKERRNSKVADVDEGVDAKADDFINKFKQQLKLQRLDSIIRYKEMVGRGSNGE